MIKIFVVTGITENEFWKAIKRNKLGRIYFFVYLKAFKVLYSTLG